MAKSHGSMEPNEKTLNRRREAGDGFRAAYLRTITSRSHDFFSAPTHEDYYAEYLFIESWAKTVSDGMLCGNLDGLHHITSAMSSNNESSYHIGFKKGTIKLFELRNVSTCLQYLLPTLKSQPPTFSLLDVGCGPGSITLDLARRFPQAKIIGVDQSAEVTDRNRASVEALAPNTRVEFRQGDVLKPETFLTPEEMQTKFDVVHEHTTLICIPENAPVLKKMRTLAKPNGGIVACRDGDTQSQVLWPPCPENAELQERIYRMNGLETQTGRQLIHKALAAGFRRDQITASASVLSNITPEERFAYAGSMLDILADENSEYRQAAAKFGYTAEQIDVLRANMQRFINAEDGWRLLICTEIICRLDEV
ncbi:methyltransferase- family protein [Colletotrichum karsti]|uniref:Methyltransferase- family protein n=1 Tax=Colletotrichum karsti TaxID=1095194 RepID=A0A9P6IDN3_9PEZI|nr:methyltransferase- family protein [Colletotrichum karsti]KAF9880524.1 methyltransferase- family protein [Colletotrichum karsti]